MKKSQQLTLLGFALMLVVVMFGTYAIKRANSHQEAQAADAESLVSKPDTSRQGLPTMLELGSEGCIPCEKMKPVLASLREKHSKLIVVEFHDVREDPDIAARYRIRLIPTQVFLKSDGTEFFRHEGFYSLEECESVFSKMGVVL